MHLQSGFVSPEHSVSPESIVTLDQVAFGYDSRAVLSRISMHVPRGKIVAVMGGSGCGKTTILRLIGGQIKASAGQVSVNGRDVAALGHGDLYKMRRRMGMMFQFGALFTDLSVYENVAFPLREHTRLPESLIRDLVLMKLQAVGLRGASALMPASLSGGMARRVALARAIAIDPMLMLYDEPFTGLDPISLRIIADLIRELNDALGAASVLVTHDVEASFRIVDHVYIIAAGRVIADGTPDQIRNSTDPQVHQFVHGESDGPVRFHYGDGAYAADLGLGPRP